MGSTCVQETQTAVCIEMYVDELSSATVGLKQALSPGSC